LLDDPSGNSFIENPKAPEVDANMKTEHYIRSEYQNAQLGLASEISGKFSDNVNSLRRGAKRKETIALLVLHIWGFVYVRWTKSNCCCYCRRELLNPKRSKRFYTSPLTAPLAVLKVKRE